MDFEKSARTREYEERLLDFMDARVYPAEAVYDQQLRASGDPHHQPPVMEELKAEARRRGLWNLFQPHQGWGPRAGARDLGHDAVDASGPGLSNLEYAPLAEILGRSAIASEACNCSAPDTGNMEVLTMFGTAAQQAAWLRPLLDGEIRSAFAMTEPDVASSDATNISLRIERDGDEYVLNGRKWWISGALHPHCRILIVMGKTDPAAATHRQQSQILVPLDTPGVTVVRGLPVFGYQDQEGHAEILFEDVRVPAANKLEGANSFKDTNKVLTATRGGVAWEAIGHAIASYEAALQYAKERVQFGKPIASFQLIQSKLANMLAEITNMQLMVYRLSQLQEQGKMTGPMASLAKMNNAKKAKQVCSDARDIMGGNGVLLEYHVARHLSDMEIVYTYEGTDTIQSLIVGRDVTGISAFV